MLERRQLLALLAASVSVAVPSHALRAMESLMEEVILEYGLIRQIIVQPDMRGAYVQLVRQMNELVGQVGGTTVFEDAANENAVWSIEFWASKSSRDEALARDTVAALIEKLQGLTLEVATEAQIQLPKLD